MLVPFTQVTVDRNCDETAPVDLVVGGSRRVFGWSGCCPLDVHCDSSSGYDDSGFSYEDGWSIFYDHFVDDYHDGVVGGVFDG
jgi:hypothetical protein